MRKRMSARLDESLPPPATDAMARRVTPADAPALARLMLDAYRGTVDDGGEGPDQATAEVANLLSGGYGIFDLAASEVVCRDCSAQNLERSGTGGTPVPPLDSTSRDEVIVSATLVTEYDGGAMVAFSMTAPAWQRRGLARAGLLRTMARLRDAGRDRVDLAVTSTNTPAVTLYLSLGFREVPR